MAIDKEEPASSDIEHEQNGRDGAQAKPPEKIGFFHPDLKDQRGKAYRRWALTSRFYSSLCDLSI